MKEMNEVGESTRQTPPSTEPASVGEGASLINASGDGSELDPSAESELWSGRTHWKHYMARVIVWLIGVAACAILLSWLAPKWDWLTGHRAFWTAMVVFLISGAFVVGRIAWTVIGLRYRLTNQRLFIQKGILRQTMDQTELIRVDDVRLYKTLVDRIFGLGTVSLITTDASDRETTIEGIRNPEEVAEAIRHRMRTMRRKSLFVENL